MPTVPTVPPPADPAAVAAQQGEPAAPVAVAAAPAPAPVVPVAPTAPAAAHVAPTGSTTGPVALPGATVHRDPVTTLDGHVVGYCISVSIQAATPGRHDAAHPAAAPTPADLLHAHYMALDLPNLVADRYAFLPATQRMLDGFVPAPVVPGRLVLELPLGFEHTPDAVQRAAALRALGMELALLDYRGGAEQEGLLPHLGFVVIDPAPPGLPLSALVHHVHDAGARVLAADVRDPRLQDECRAAGVDGLRGGYGARVEAPDGQVPAGGSRVLRAGELQCLALMHLLAQPDVDFSEVAQVVDTDPVLTLRVLHLVNSGAFGLAREVDTVHQAVVLLGVREVITLVAALMLDARPDAMDSLWFILARSLTCEALADDSTGYTVGMLSALAHQLGVPADVILDKVGVSAAVAEAVRSEAGPLGAVLAAVRAHEDKDTAGVLAAGMLPAEVSAVYVRCVRDALATARTVTRAPATF